MTHIISYNVNGIRAALKKEFIPWLKKENPDVLCLQEIKAEKEQIPLELFEELGYHAEILSAEKKGYSGVATFSKQKPDSVKLKTGMKAYDSEGRILQTDFEDWCLLNCYFPSGSSGEERHEFKMQFLNDFGMYVKKILKKKKKLIVVGDYNVVRLDHDIHNPTRKDKPSGFRPEERAWLNEWFEKDFGDAFRMLHPDEENNFSWWSYRMGARKRNKGWRIDYISLSNEIKTGIKASGQLHEAVHSDHCPVFVKLDL